MLEHAFCLHFCATRNATFVGGDLTLDRRHTGGVVGGRLLEPMEVEKFLRSWPSKGEHVLNGCLKQCVYIILYSTIVII